VLTPVIVVLTRSLWSRTQVGPAPRFLDQSFLDIKRPTEQGDAMATWDPDRYLAFADERSRPFVDLLQRIGGSPTDVLDLGCGPGQLSALMRARWPACSVLGIDSSPQMIERARADNADPAVSYVQQDVQAVASGAWAPGRRFDLVISNATFQWIPDQLDLLPLLVGRVRPGGTFAFQVPNNFDAPSHRLLAEVSAREPYAVATGGVLQPRGVEATTYLRLLSGPDRQVDAWTTTYLHVLPGEDAVLRWISATGARPVLQALGDDLRVRFEAEYGAELRAAYPREEIGTVLPFERVFVVATLH
jgi:trans-aconitate 2-methyltransferase